MSFINDTRHTKLTSVTTDEAMSSTTIVNKLVDKSDRYMNIRKPIRNATSLPRTGPESTPRKGVKGPPILDSKLRISQQAGSYPTERSADLCRTLTAEVNIGGVDAFVLFDSGAETDTLSPDFIRACNIPLLELPNPMVLQMGTKGSRSCVYYGTNMVASIHGITKSHYFDVVNIDRYNAILGAPWLNTNGAILNFRNHTVNLPSGDIRTFGVLTEQEFCSVGHKAKYGQSSNNASHTMGSPSKNE